MIFKGLSIVRNCLRLENCILNKSILFLSIISEKWYRFLIIRCQNLSILYFNFLIKFTITLPIKNQCPLVFEWNLSLI